MGAMRIGDVAGVAGVPTQTIRFYERRGLLPPPQRRANGYRDYEDSAVARLRFIRRSQAAGLTLMEVSSVLALRDAGDAPCTHVQSLLAAKLAEVRDRQRELAALETELEALITRGEELDPADCSDAAICQIIGSATSTGQAKI